jgi:hypothetical protein
MASVLDRAVGSPAVSEPRTPGAGEAEWDTPADDVARAAKVTLVMKKHLAREDKVGHTLSFGESAATRGSEGDMQEYRNMQSLERMTEAAELEEAGFGTVQPKNRPAGARTDYHDYHDYHEVVDEHRPLRFAQG